MVSLLLALALWLSLSLWLSLLAELAPDAASQWMYGSTRPSSLKPPPPSWLVVTIGCALDGFVRGHSMQMQARAVSS